MVSVVVPVYNVELYLHQCIDSIINQTYKELEIILVNDGSTDSSGAICDEYAKKDNRIIVVHKENGGLSDARNAGIEKSSGEYICFIDSDDYIDSYMIENLFMACTQNNAQVSLCMRKFFYADQKIEIENKGYNTKIFNNLESFKHFLLEDIDGFVVAWNKLYKISLFIDNDIRYPKGIIHEDCFTTYKLLLQSTTIAYIDYVGYFYRQRNGSIMNNSNFEKDYVMVEAYEEILNLVKASYQELIDAAEYRYILTNLYVASKITNLFDNKNIQFCKNNIRKMNINNNSYLNMFKRLRINVFILFPTAYILLYKIKNR